MSLLRTRSGIPAVVVPLQGRDEAGVLVHARDAVAAGADVVEWRLDAWGAHDAARATAMLPHLREALGAVPVLATYRSLAEGGPGTLDDDAYGALLSHLLELGIDGVDVELTRPEAGVADLVAAARLAGTTVVGSSHDFAGTPTDAELARRFDSLAARGCDVLKVAVTAADDGDVQRLLLAAAVARRHGVDVLPIAMGDAGVVTRIAGECWASPATFGTVGAGTAPGQVPLPQLRAALVAVHEALTAARA